MDLAHLTLFEENTVPKPKKMWERRWRDVKDTGNFPSIILETIDVYEEESAPSPAKKAAISGLNDISHRSPDRQYSFLDRTALFFDPDATPPMHNGEPGIPKYFRGTPPPSSLSPASTSEGAPSPVKEAAITGLSDISCISPDGQHVVPSNAAEFFNQDAMAPTDNEVPAPLKCLENTLLTSTLPPASSSSTGSSVDPDAFVTMGYWKAAMPQHFTATVPLVSDSSTSVKDQMDCTAIPEQQSSLNYEAVLSDEASKEITRSEKILLNKENEVIPVEDVNAKKAGGPICKAVAHDKAVMANKRYKTVQSPQNSTGLTEWFTLPCANASSNSEKE